MQLIRDHNRYTQGFNPNKEEENIVGPYKIQDRIVGQGTTGVVKLAIHRETGKFAAVKVVSKSISLKRKEAKKEVKILTNVNHESLIKLEHFDEDPNFIYIFTEYCEEGDLYSYMEKNGYFDENIARKLFVQLLDAVEFCHKHLRICHHDIKLENCVITSDFRLKLIDFGFAIELDNSAGKKLIEEYNSSPAYSPLEILQRRPHDESVDIFSLGICLYYMLTGRFPFCDPDATTFEELCQNLHSNVLEFSNDISSSAQDLITRLLAKRKDRIRLEEIQAHPWLNPHF